MKNIIYLDGATISADPKLLESLSPGSVQGEGVFETMRSYGLKTSRKTAKIFQLDAHLSRLARGLKILNIPEPFFLKEIKSTIEEILRLNLLGNAKVRVMVWQAGGKVHASIVAAVYKPFPESKYKKGFKAAVSKINLDSSSLLNGVKSIRYDFFLKACHRAKLDGFDEALLLNLRGEVVEGSRSNIFCVSGHILYTPPLTCGCLNGITRQAVIKIARRAGLNVQQRKVILADILKAEEIFLTNSLLEVMPVTSVDGKKINGGRPGKRTLQILREYRRLVVRYINLL